MKFTKIANIDLLIYIVFLFFKSSHAISSPRFMSETNEYCRNYSNCSLCQSDSSCSYLNGLCSSSSSSSISTDVVDTSTEYQYCNDATSNGIVNMDDLSKQQLTLYPYSNSSYLDHPYCFWNITTNSVQNITVTIFRNVSNNEDLYIQAQSFGSVKNTLNSKSLSNCQDTSFNLTIFNMTLLTIKAKRMNPNSSYRVVVSQSSSSTSEMPTFIFAGMLFFAIIFVVCILVTIICIVCKCTKRRKIFILTHDQACRIRHITQTLSCMRQGKYWNFKSRYQEENCSICLELFDDNSEVMLINECSHTFHSKCLEDWFWNIKIEQDLKCPLCCTVVSPLFKRMQSNLLPTDLSMVREINEQDESKNELNDAAYYR